jgi:hypothetical protein
VSLRSTFAIMLTILLLAVSAVALVCDANCILPASQHACCPAQMDRSHPAVASSAPCVRPTSMAAQVITVAYEMVMQAGIDLFPETPALAAPRVDLNSTSSTSPPQFHLRI